MDHKHPASYEVHTSTREEMNEGWVWVRNEADPELKRKLEGRRRIVRINNHVYCEALYMNERDLKWLKEHKPSFYDKIVSDDKLIFISQWYRQPLEVHPGNEQDLTIELTESRWEQVQWQFWACLQHPQIVVLLSTVLGIISVGLGVIGVGLGVIGLGTGLTCIPGIVIVMKWFGVACVVFGAVIIVCGVIQLFKRATYAPPC